MFLDRGFDQVTVAEVAEAAGVSKVTVFAHFPRKEDLMLDRAPEAMELIRNALRGRPAATGPVEALRALATDLLEQGHPLSGLSSGENVPFMRMVADSPALLTRARELTAGIEAELGRLLASEQDCVPDPRLLAALIVGAYRTLMTHSARRLLDGDRSEQIAVDHRQRLEWSFDALEAAAHSLLQH